MHKIKLTVEVTFNADQEIEVTDEQLEKLKDPDIPVDEVLDTEYQELCVKAVQEKSDHWTDCFITDEKDRVVRDWDRM